MFVKFTIFIINLKLFSATHCNVRKDCEYHAEEGHLSERGLHSLIQHVFENYDKKIRAQSEAEL